MTTTIYTMSLLKFVEQIKCLTSEDWNYGYDTKEEEAKDILRARKQEMMNEFRKWAVKFIEIKNSLNRGTYEFISHDGEKFTYSITN